MKYLLSPLRVVNGAANECEEFLALEAPLWGLNRLLQSYHLSMPNGEVRDTRAELNLQDFRES